MFFRRTYHGAPVAGRPMGKFDIWLCALAMCVTGAFASAQETDVLDSQRLRPAAQNQHRSVVSPLPERVRKEREVEILQKDKQIEQLRNEVEALRGVQTNELETKQIQLEKLKNLLNLDREVREGLQSSPELLEVYRQVMSVDAGSPSCDCLDRVGLNSIGSGSRAGRAFLSLDQDGPRYDVIEGGPIGDTGCRLAAVAESDVTIQCGTRSREVTVSGYTAPNR